MGNDFKDLFGDGPPDNENRKPPDDRAAEPENRGLRALNEKECKVVNVYEATYEDPDPEVSTVKTTFVLLRDNHGREFRIFVLPDVAYAVHMALEKEASERPLPHDLMKNIIERLGAVVERITIDDLWQNTFYARITMIRGTESFDIDSRPSDAIALALRFKAPIYVAESVLESAQSD